MSAFSSHQCRRYRRVFDKYASSDPNRLSTVDLYNAMPSFGPEVPAHMIRKLICQYDKTREGSLDFEDFLVLLADYQVTCESMDGMLESFFEKVLTKLNCEEGMPRQSLGWLLELNGDLKTKDIDDLCGEFYQVYGQKLKTERLLNILKSKTVWVDNPPMDRLKIGKVRITIQINKASNLDLLSKVKLRDNQISLESLDCSLTVSLGRKFKHTTVELGNLSPCWNFPLEFAVVFPSFEIAEAQAWIEGQAIHFHLFDNEVNGLVPHVEWLAHGSIPLSSIMYEPSSSIYSALTLKLDEMPSGTDFKNGPELDFSIKVTDDTCLPLNKGDMDNDHFVADFFSSRENLWLKYYSNAFRSSIAKSFVGMPSMSRNIESEICSYIVDIDEEFSTKFPTRRRVMPLCAISEEGDFLFLPCFAFSICIPQDLIDLWKKEHITSKDSKGLKTASYSPKKTSDEEFFARFVSRVPLTDDIKSGSRKVLVSEEKKENADTIFASSALTDIGSEKNDYTFVCSPSAFLLNNHGSVLEHALFLHGIFTGMGKRAYIAAGTFKKKDYVWVVVLDAMPDVADASGSNKGSSLSLVKGSALSVNASSVGGSKASSNESLHEFKPEEFTYVDNTVVDENVYHIDPLTARFYRQFENGKESPLVPFDTVGCLFDSENIYVNVGESAYVKKIKAWDPTCHDIWYSVLEHPRCRKWGSISCAHRAPFTISLPIEPLTDLVQKTLLKDIASAIQGYRKHVLFIPKTIFHREASKALSNFVHKLEERYHPLSSQTLDDMSFERQHMKKIHNKITSIIPNGCYWNGRIFHFATKDVSEILDTLIQSGILDWSAHNVAYAITLKTYLWPFNTYSTWMIVGQVVRVGGGIK